MLGNNINVLAGHTWVLSVSDCWTAIRAGLCNRVQLAPEHRLQQITHFTAHKAFSFQAMRTNPFLGFWKDTHSHVNVIFLSVDAVL